ncbi:MAG TPA: hypothetical protein HA327_00585 [Candidatus Poseidoniaceae archaeon]|nr:MAG TPA: hypothetical protein D7H81_00570 [Candidatus Poseidoniales archaeon]HII44513.1 hypothetical protein [Candidatus Poseidoniaceae archaeon]
MTDESILRIAAIYAVLSIVENNARDSSKIGRNPGPVWTQDHIRMNTGKNSLMNRKSSRSPWR